MHCSPRDSGASNEPPRSGAERYVLVLSQSCRHHICFMVHRHAELLRAPLCLCLSCSRCILDQVACCIDSTPPRTPADVLLNSLVCAFPQALAARANARSRSAEAVSSPRHPPYGFRLLPRSCLSRTLACQPRFACCQRCELHGVCSVLAHLPLAASPCHPLLVTPRQRAGVRVIPAVAVTASLPNNCMPPRHKS